MTDKLYLSVSVAALVIFSTTIGEASGRCERVFSDSSWAKLTTQEQRRELVTELKQTHTPAFIKDTRTGPLPVVLMNDASRTKIPKFMNETIGVQILLQPENDRDHGVARMGGFAIKADGKTRLTSLQVDWAPPLMREKDEMHTTGIVWRDLDQLMHKVAQKGNYNKVSIELTFAATARERSDFEYYHRIRRAGLFGIATYDWKGNPQPPVADVPNQMPFKDCMEDCFDFARGRNFGKIREFVQSQLKTAGVSDVDAFQESRAVREFLASAKATVMKADAWSALEFNHSLLMRDEKTLGLGQKILPVPLKSASTQEIESFLNSVAMLDAVTHVKALFEKLGIGDDIYPHNNLDNPKLTAVLIFAPQSEAARFQNATYHAPGSFQRSGWGEDPTGLQPYRDQRPLEPTK